MGHLTAVIEIGVNMHRIRKIPNIQFTISIDNASNDDFEGFVEELEGAGFNCCVSRLKTTVYILNDQSRHAENLRKVKRIIEENLKKGNCGTVSLTDIRGKTGYDYYPVR